MSSPSHTPLEKRSPSPSPIKKTVIETRRAEQNRAAQRAFRQRKERYVKELEAKVNSMADWPARMQHLESENKELKIKISELLKEKQDIHSIQTIGSPPLSSAALAAVVEQAQATTKVIGEKGRVLDDLVSILRTRTRPPIPTHPPN